MRQTAHHTSTSSWQRWGYHQQYTRLDSWFGLIAPVLCLLVDPMVFRDLLSDDRGVLGAYRWLVSSAVPILTHLPIVCSAAMPFAGQMYEECDDQTTRISHRTAGVSRLRSANLHPYRDCDSGNK